MGKKSKKSNKTNGTFHKFSGKGPTHHIIVEMHNVAEFLSTVSNMLGKEGTKNLQGLHFETDVISSKPGYIDNTRKTMNINHVLWAKIGKKGVPVTVDDVISMLQFMLPKVPERENEYYPYFIDLLKAVKGMVVGKDGPCYLEHGIVTSSNEDVKLDVLRKAKDQMLLVEPGHLAFGFEDTSGEMSTIPIGEKGRKVTLDDIIDTFRYVSTHERLEKFRHSGRSYYLEGFKIKGYSGKTLSVTWGS